MLNLQTQVRRRLPDFRMPLQVLRVIVFAQGLALLLAFAPFTVDSSPWYRLGFISLFVQWIALISCLAFSFFTPLLSKVSLWQLAIITQVILLSITAGCTFVSFWYFQQLVPEVSLSVVLTNNLLICFIVALLVIQFLIMADEQSKRITAHSQAELTALQARIKPHFLFNTLNSMAELIHQDAAAAEAALLDLAALFRAAMQSTMMIPLAEELALCRRYLSLEQWRLGERLSVNWQLVEPLPQLTLPALTLQPLIENAILHGIEPVSAGGEITVAMALTKKQLKIEISNPLCSASKRSQHGGMALQNIRQRLAYVFGEEALLVVVTKEQSFSVTLLLPMTHQDE